MLPSLTTALFQYMLPTSRGAESMGGTTAHAQENRRARSCDKDGTLANVRNVPCSNQKTRNQFRQRIGKGGATSYQLRQYAEVTLGGGSLRKVVKLPEGEDENEWLAVNSMT